MGWLLSEGGGDDVLKIEIKSLEMNLGPVSFKLYFTPNLLKDTIQLDEKDNSLNGFYSSFFVFWAFCNQAIGVWVKILEFRSGSEKHNDNLRLQFKLLLWRDD